MARVEAKEQGNREVHQGREETRVTTGRDVEEEEEQRSKGPVEREEETLMEGVQEKKEDAVVWMRAGVKCRGGAGANRSEGGGEQGWGAEIYVWRGLQRGSRGKQPGLL